MKRLDFKESDVEKIDKTLKDFSENTTIFYDIDQISIVGDLLDYDKEVDKPSLFLQVSDLDSLDDDNDDILSELERDMYYDIKAFNVIVSDEPCKFKHTKIEDFIYENKNRYKIELAESNTVNIFTNETAKELFYKLARDQRGHPENEMRIAQKLMGGGRLSNLIEHIGDLTHRMSQEIYISHGEVSQSINDIESKLSNGLNVLKNEDEMKKEVFRNRKSNFDFNLEHEQNFTFENYNEFDNACNKALERYKKEHSKLTVYNDIQYAAKYAAVHLGNGDYKKSREQLLIIQNSIDDGSYAKRASMFKSDYELKDLNTFKNKINAKYKHEIKKFNIQQNNDVIRLDDIVIDSKYRDEGIGTELMKDLIHYAKYQKLAITLQKNEKDLQYGTKSKEALERFYKKLGFKENKGANKDDDFNHADLRIDFRKKNKSKLKLKQ